MVLWKVDALVAWAMVLWKVDALVAWTESSLGNGALESGCTGSMDGIIVGQRAQSEQKSSPPGPDHTQHIDRKYVESDALTYKLGMCKLTFGIVEA